MLPLDLTHLAQCPSTPAQISATHPWLFSASSTAAEESKYISMSLLCSLQGGGDGGASEGDGERGQNYWPK